MNRPFSNKNLESYQNYKSPRKESPNKKEKLLIASPTKTANFSPYKRFRRQSCSINLNKNSKDILRNMNMSPSKSPTKDLDKDGEINIPKKKNTSKILKGIIKLQSLGDDDKILPSSFKNLKNDKELDFNRVDELVNTKKKKEIRDSESPIKPVFKQSSKFGKKIKKDEKKKAENNIQIIDNEEEEEEKENRKKYRKY